MRRPRRASGRARPAARSRRRRRARAASVISGPVILVRSPPARSSMPRAISAPLSAARGPRGPGPSRGVLLEAAVVAAAAEDAVGYDAHVTDLGTDAVRAAVDLAVEHEPTAHAGADGDQQQVVDVVRRRRTGTRPRRRRSRRSRSRPAASTRFSSSPLRSSVAPREVRREQHDGPRLVDVPRPRRPRRSRSSWRERSSVTRPAMAPSIASASVAGDSTRSSSRIVPSSSTTPPAILVPPTSMPQARLMSLSSVRPSRPARRPGRCARPARTRRSARRGARPSARRRPAATRRGGRQLVSTSGLGLAHGVHGAADRAPRALGGAGRQVARRPRAAGVAWPSPTGAPRSWTASSRRAHGRRRRRSGSSRSAGSWSPSSPSSTGRPRRTAPAAPPAPPGRRRPGPRQPGRQREQPTIRSHGHDQIVAVARQVDVGARHARQRAGAAPRRRRSPRRSGTVRWPVGRRERVAAGVHLARPASVSASTPTGSRGAVLRAPHRQPGEGLLHLLEHLVLRDAPSRPASRRRPRPGTPGWRPRRRRGSRTATASCSERRASASTTVLGREHQPDAGVRAGEQLAHLVELGVQPLDARRRRCRSGIGTPAARRQHRPQRLDHPALDREDARPCTSPAPRAARAAAASPRSGRSRRRSTSQSPESACSRSSSSASTSSAPGITVSSSAATGSTPATSSTESR